MAPRIILIDNNTQYLSELTGYLNDLGTEVDLTSPLCNFQIDEYDGAIVSGGRMPPGNHKPIYDWYSELFEEAGKSGIPVLAICFGHLIFGLTQGGSIKRMDLGEEGIIEVNFEEGYPLAPDGHRLRVFVSRDRILQRVPPSSNVWGVSSKSSAEALSYGSIFTVGFHPEVRESRNQGQMILDGFYQICGGSER